MLFASINDVVLHYDYRRGGAGNPIVFVNSLGTDFRIWDDVARLVAPARDALVYDKAGHGLSDRSDRDDQLDTHVDHLSGLLDQLGIRKAIICGLSVGGLIAQRLHSRRPDLLSGVILCCTGARIGSSEIWDQRIAGAANGLSTLADATMQRWLTPAFHASNSFQVAGYRNMFSRQPSDSYIDFCKILRASDCTQDAREIAVPVLCIAGEQDSATPPDVVRYLAGLIRNARLRIIENAAHLPCIEQPEQFATIVEDFFRECRI